MMPGIGVGTVLTDDWNIPENHIGQYRYSHKTKPYTIEIRGYEVTLFNHTTCDFVTTEKETEFEVLQAVSKMATLPSPVLQEQVNL